MFSLTVPIVTTVIGEGGSGGALAIGCCDRMVMMENAVYYVASPEACAAILWKTAKAAPKVSCSFRMHNPGFKGYANGDWLLLPKVARGSVS